MQRRKLLATIGASAGTLVAVSPSATAQESEISIEEAREKLYDAAKKDAKRQDSPENKIDDESPHVTEALKEIPEDIRAEIAENHLKVDANISEVDVTSSDALV